MKSNLWMFLSLLAFVFTFLTSSQALAVGSGALPIRRIYTTSPISIYNHAELVSSTSKGIKGVQVNNTGVHPVLLAFGPSSGEVDQVIIGGAEDTGYLPLSGGYATRLSAITLDGPNETGELDVNVFYN